MKKYVFCLILTLSLSSVGYAQNVDNLLKKVSSTENVDKVKIGGFLMALGKMFGGVGDMPVARGINGVEVYDLSGCDSKFKQELKNEFNKIKDGNGYETLIYAKDGGEGVRIMVKKDKKNIIKEMVILCMDKKDPAIIRLSGKIHEKDIAELVNEYKNK